MQQTNIDSEMEEDSTTEEDFAAGPSEIVEPENVKSGFEIFAESLSKPDMSGLQTDRGYLEQRASELEQEDIKRAKIASLRSNSQNPDLKEYRAAEKWRSLLKPSEQDHISETDSITGEIGCETVLRLSNEFAPIVEKDADTLLYIGPPPRAHNQDDHEYEHIQSHFCRPYLMKSETLKKVESAQFAKFLGPMSARTERKLKKLNIHKRVMQPEKIKYYIDLRPMLDDEEALLILTELTSTPDILTWHTKSNKYGIPPELICGRDNLNIPEKPRHRWSFDSEEEDIPMKRNNFDQFVPIIVRPDEKQWKPKTEPKKSSSQIYQEKIAALRQQPPEPDYSPLRHHVAIERLLHAIAGEDPRLDSAPKAWTYFSIAKYFDCVNSPRVNSWITTWLLSSNNSNFIQSNPEVVYRLASGIKSPDMLRCSFAMLVGERALLRVQTPHSPQMSNKSVHGRSFALLDDDDLNRIDHAVPSLIRRVKTLFDKLADRKLSWAIISANREKQALDAIEAQNEEEQEILDEVHDDLSNYVRRIIFSALNESLSPDLAKVSDEFVRNRDIYHSLPLNARIYTQTFWSELRQRGLLSSDEPGALIPKTGWDSARERLKTEGIIPQTENINYISLFTLYESFSTLNKMLLQRHRAVDAEGNPITTNYVGDPRLSIDTIDEYGRPLPQYPSYTTSFPPIASNWNPWSDHDSAHRRHQQELQAKTRTSTFQHVNPRAALETQVDAETLSPLDPLRRSESDLDPNLVFPTQQQTDVVLQTEDNDNSTQAKNSRDVNDIFNSSEDFEGYNPFPMADQAAKLSNDAGEDTMLSQTEQSQGLRVVPETGLYPPQPSLPFRPAYQRDITFPKGAAVSKNVRFGVPSVIGQRSHTWTSEDTPQPAPSDTHTTTQRVQNILTDADRQSTTTIRSVYDMPAQSPKSPKGHFYDPWKKEEFGLISAPALMHSLNIALSNFISSYILNPGYVADGTCDLDIPIQDLDTLLCLTEDEWKYLPLWAGGFDDGSGGVFASDDLGGGDLPDALDVGEGGFRGGPTAGLLSSGAPTEVAESVCMVDVSDLGDSEDGFEDINTEEGVSTVGKASRVATDGTRGDASTVMSLDD